MRVGQIRGDLYLTQKAVHPYVEAQFSAEDLESDGSVVFDIPREVHGRHSPAAELALDGVAVRKSGAEAVRDVRHHANKMGVSLALRSPK